MEGKETIDNAGKQRFFRRLKQNRPAWLGFLFILAFSIISILGYLITTDRTHSVNIQQLSLAASPPGTKVTFLYEKKKLYPANWWEWAYGMERQEPAIPVQNLTSKDGYFYAESLGDSSHHFVVDEVRGEARKTTFFLGTDGMGRDLYSRLVIGTRVSLSVGLVAVLISLLVGSVMGSIAGYFGGKADAFISFLIQVFWSIPGLLLVMAVSVALGKGLSTVFIAVGLGMWVEVARVVRGEILSIKEREFVQAAKVMGFSSFRIIRKHLFPSLAGPVIIVCTSNFAGAILIESGLSFLGLGVQPPMPSLGTIIRENYPYLMMGNAWLALIPGLVIVLLVTSFNLIGGGLSDAFNVKLNDR